MRVAVTSKAFAKSPELIAYLADRFPDYRLNPMSRALREDELVEFLDGVDGLILALESLGEPVLCRAPHLRVISKFGVGLDNVDLAACERWNVPVLSAQGVNAQYVAEFALAQILSVLRNTVGTSRKLADGIWHKDGGRSLYGRCVGIVGFGHVGQAFARLLKTFHCDIVFSDILDKRDQATATGAQQVELGELIQHAEIISLHCPLTPATRHLVNEPFLAEMKRHSVLVNTARGGIVDEDALVRALQAGHLYGAALDVFEHEPPTNMALLSHPAVLCTPHVAGNSREATSAMGRAAIDLLTAHFGYPTPLP